jgi:hypothetical protein
VQRERHHDADIGGEVGECIPHQAFDDTTAASMTPPCRRIERLEPHANSSRAKDGCAASKWEITRYGTAASARTLLRDWGMADFLDTTAISYRIERLLKDAQHRIVLISPYLKLRPRIRELIEDAVRRGVAVQVVYGKKEDCGGADQLRDMRGVQVTFCKNVHTKCYLNEQTGIITSLNLYDFSEARNQEMGVLFDRTTDPELFGQASEEADRIIRISGGNVVEQTAVTASVAEEPGGGYGKLTTGKLAEKLGIELTKLYEKLIGRGYLELRDGGKRYITAAGKKAGGEFRMGKGPYFLWPADLQV